MSHEGLELENPGVEPNWSNSFLEMSVLPQNAPDKETQISITFEKGIPVALNDEKLDGVTLIQKLNKIGGENGCGIVDIVENRLVGIKSRGVYETPGGSILMKAHSILETICLDKDTMHYKEEIAGKIAELIYDGKWFTKLLESLMCFVDSTQEYVTGKVKLKLYKGNIIPAGVESKYSIYSKEIATFGEDNSYNQKDSEGFINLFGLQMKMTSLMKSKLGE